MSQSLQELGERGEPQPGHPPSRASEIRPRTLRDSAHRTKRVLFICTDNSARSQMAEALLNSYYGDRYSAFSAGTSPRQVDPRAVRVMEEIGVDISKNRSKSLTEFIGSEFDYVVTVCDQVREACPFFPAKKVIHKGFEDPARLKGSEDEVLARFRLIRDQIKSWIEETFGGARRRVAGEGDG